MCVLFTWAIGICVNERVLLTYSLCMLNLFLLKDFIYLLMRDTEKEAEEKQTPCREPNVGLHPGTLGSHPEPKADAQTAEPPRCPNK